MKKTNEKLVLTTEQFDVEDVITASAPGQMGGRLTSTHDNFSVEVPLGDLHFN